MPNRILMKSILFVFLICATSTLGCDSGTGRNTGVSNPSESNQAPATSGASLNDKIYDLNYSAAHKGGIDAAKEDKEKNLPYQPEVVLAQPAFQTVIKMYSNEVAKTHGETYRPDAERGFRDGFMAGYKEGYK